MHARMIRKDEDAHAVDMVDVRVCDSLDHPKRLATKRLFWVDGPVEYCEPCCAAMLRIAEVLGFAAHTEPIAPPPALPPARRAMTLTAEGTV